MPEHANPHYNELPRITMNHDGLIQTTMDYDGLRRTTTNYDEPGAGPWGQGPGWGILI